MIILKADTCGGLALSIVTHLIVPQPCGQVLSFFPFTDEKTEAQRAVAGRVLGPSGPARSAKLQHCNTPSALGGSPSLTPASPPPDRVPPARALRAAQSLLACGAAQGYLTPNYEVKGHRDVQQTLSPGDQLYEIIQQWPHYRSV